MASFNSVLRGFMLRLRGGPARRPQRDAVIQTGLDHPRDLDTPFSDPEAKARVAQLIAEKAKRARKNK